MADKYFADQFDDEEVLLVFRKHPVVMRKGLIFSSLALLVGPVYTLALTFLHASNPPTVSFFFVSFVISLVISIMVFFPSWLSWYFSVFIVTDQRLIQITQKGFFSREVNDLTLNNIQNVNYKVEGFQAALFGFGTVTIETLSGGKPIKLRYIHGPAEFAQSVSQVSRVTQG